ncbi:MAG TPA: hypothetical protein VLC55_06410 [Burkholderiales bacterium]|nr:hypothetical protein [Burkholderiales bacterium]
MTPLTHDQLATLSSESEKDFRECFIEDAANGQIRFTAKGFAAYGPRFAKAGIDIHQIRTREELREACARSAWVFAEELREMVKGHKELEMILKPLWS